MTLATDSLSNTFAALADPTRREILAQLAQGGQKSVTELAEPFEMSLPAVSRHLKVLEGAGLIERSREAQYRPARLQSAPLQAVDQWLERYRQNWEQSFRKLDDYLDQMQKKKEGLMSADQETQIRQEGKSLHIRRQFTAPRDLVYKAFSEYEHLTQWWAPEGWALTACDIDFKPKGSWHYQLSSDDGETQSWVLANYKDVESPAHIAYDERFVDAERQPVGSMPVQHISMQFSEENGVTRLDYEAAFDSEEDMQKILDMGVVEYFSSSLTRLEEHLASPR